jgi:hypothetical protein
MSYKALTSFRGGVDGQIDRQLDPTPGRYTVSTRPAKYEVALDNDRVRAWRLKLNPGEKGC